MENVWGLAVFLNFRNRRRTVNKTARVDCRSKIVHHLLILALNDVCGDLLLSGTVS